MKSSLVALSVLLLATAAQAQSNTPAGESATQATAPSDAQDDAAARRRDRDERVSCRQVEEKAGSRLTRRVCLTARQWRQRGGF